MPDSNGCGLTNYEEGPDEREDELTTGDPPDIPNGHGSNPPPDGGTYGNHVPCTEDESPYDYLYECLDEHSNAKCDVICHGNEDDGGGDGLPEGSEYWGCVAMEISLFCADWTFWCFTLCPSVVSICLADPSKVTCLGALTCLGLPATYGMGVCL